MATAELTEIPQPVKYEVTLTMSEEDARLLVGLLRCVGGPPRTLDGEWSVRGHLTDREDGILKVLQKKVGKHNLSPGAGSLHLERHTLAEPYYPF